MASTVRSGGDRGRPGRLRGGDPGGAARDEGGVRREGPHAGWHVPERRLHSQQGDARLERALSPGARSGSASTGSSSDGIKLDLAAMLARKDEVVKGLTDGVRFLFRKNRIETIFGTGRVSSPTTRSRSRLNDGGSVELTAGHILLATGSEPVNLPFLPFDGKTVVDSTGALASTRFPSTWSSSAPATSGSSWARSGGGWGRRSR